MKTLERYLQRALICVLMLTLAAVVLAIPILAWIDEGWIVGAPMLAFMLLALSTFGVMAWNERSGA